MHTVTLELSEDEMEKLRGLAKFYGVSTTQALYDALMTANRKITRYQNSKSKPAGTPWCNDANSNPYW